MFCPNCGKQLPDDAKFCGGCGTRMEAPKPAPDANKPPVGIKIPVPNIPLSGNRMEELKKRSLFFFGSLVTLLLALFFLLGNQLKGKVSLFGYTETQNFSMFMDHNFWKVLFILLFLAAIVVALLPLITGGKWKLWNQIPAAAVSALSVLWLLIVFVAAKIEMRNYGFGSSAKLGLSFAGVMLLLLDFGTIALSVLSFLKDMKDGMKFL